MIKNRLWGEVRDTKRRRTLEVAGTGCVLRNQCSYRVPEGPPKVGREGCRPTAAADASQILRAFKDPKVTSDYPDLLGTLHYTSAGPSPRDAIIRVSQSPHSFGFLINLFICPFRMSPNSLQPSWKCRLASQHVISDIP